MGSGGKSITLFFLDIDAASGFIVVEEGGCMEYTVKRLADLAGVSSRTLRYYDQIGLLKPSFINESGYRIYGSTEVDLLQQILFYRELGVSLERIREIVYSPNFQEKQALIEHWEQLLKKRERLDVLIANVEQTIASLEGGRKMTDQEKFAGFKRSIVNENEQKYGREVRAKYGDAVVDASNAKVLGMSKDQYNRANKLAEEIMQTLKAAMETNDPAGELAQKAAALHREWLSLYWDTYSKEAHAGLAQMYVADERFSAYYDKDKPGTAEFLRDAILIYTGVEK